MTEKHHNPPLMVVEWWRIWSTNSFFFGLCITSLLGRRACSDHANPLCDFGEIHDSIMSFILLVKSVVLKFSHLAHRLVGYMTSISNQCHPCWLTFLLQWIILTSLFLWNKLTILVEFCRIVSASNCPTSCLG